MNSKYQLTFRFFDTEREAKAFCKIENENASSYVRRKHKAHHTPWSSQDGLEHKYIAWYVY
jgi:hypothetical protein